MLKVAVGVPKLTAAQDKAGHGETGKHIVGHDDGPVAVAVFLHGLGSHSFTMQLSSVGLKGLIICWLMRKQPHLWRCIAWRVWVSKALNWSPSREPV